MPLTEEQIEAKVAEGLRNLEDDGTPEELEGDISASEPEGTSPVEDAPVSVEESVSGDTPVESTEVEVEELPDNFRRAAIHQGWSDDEINEFYKESPTLATKTLSKIHEATNALSNQFAEAGRPSIVPVAPVSDPIPQSGKLGFRGVDLSKFREEYEGEPIFDAISQLNDQLVRTSTPTAPVVADPVPQAALQTELAEYLGGQIDQFFASVDPIATKHYGKGDWKSLTQDEHNHRMEMLQTADAIKAGAAMQGVRMSSTDAMSRAHIMSTNEIKTEQVRSGIKATLQKRTNNLTIEPTGSPTIPENIASLTEMQIEDRAKKRLDKLFKQ